MDRLKGPVEPNGPRHAVAVVWVLGLVLTASVTAWQARANAQIASARFREASQVVVDRLAERLRTGELGLREARGMVLAGGPEALTPEAFERLARSRDAREAWSGSTSVAVVWGRAAAALAADGAARPADRYVVGPVDPPASNRVGSGVDLAAHSGLRQAADTATRSGAATLSAPFPAPGETWPGASAVRLLLPLYRAGASTATESDRERASLGWATLLVQAERLVTSLASADDAAVPVSVRDRDDPAGAAIFVAPGASLPAAAGLVRTVEMPVYGRTWAVELRAAPGASAAEGQTPPGAVFAVGALLTALASALARRLAADARRAARLGNAHARLAAIVDSSSSDAIVGETLHGTITDWNAGAEHLFGHDAAAAIGRSMAELLVPADLQAEHLRLRDQIGRGIAVPAFDTHRLHRDGRRLEVSVAASPIVAADGRIAGLAKTVRDIREARSAERQNREMSSRLEQRVAERTASLETARHDLQTLLDAIPAMVAYWDRDLRSRVTNRAYQEWFGFDAETLRGMRLPEVLGPELYACNERFVVSALNGEPQTFERTMTHANGTRRDALAHYLPDVIDGEVRGFYVFFHDVSEITSSRKRLAAALRDNEALLSTIHQHAIVSVANRFGRIADVNDSFCRISGYRRDELIGQDHRIVNSGVQVPAFWSAMWRQIASGQPWRGEICNRAKDGSLYWVDSIIAPFVGADGEIEKYISIRFDITAARRAEQALRASEAFLDRAGEIAQVGGWELDLRTEALSWSRQTCRIHDLPVDHQPDLASAIGFYAPEARPQIAQAVERAIADGTPWDLELPLITATGRRIWARAQGVADFEAGRPIRLLGAFQDITERRQAAAALQEANDRFALAAESAHIGVWQYDPASHTLVWDDRMYRLYGQASGDAPPPLEVWRSRVHPDDLAPTLAAHDAALRGERDYDPEYRIVWPGGEVRYVKASAKASRDASGAVVRLTGVNIDITERKRAEIELVATSQLLGTVLESASEFSIIAADPGLTITVFNEGAQRLLGYRADEVIGRATPLLIHDPDEVRQRAEELGERLGRPVEASAVFTEPSTLTVPREWTYVRKDGSRVRVSLVVTPMRAADGALLGYLGIAQDVTQQRAHEASLRHAIQKANQASLAKSHFLANMSHEIRTPMNAVIGLTYLLGQSTLDAVQAETLDKLRSAAKSLLGLINNVLDLSQIEAGELRLEQAPFSLRTVLLELGGMLSVQAQAKRIGFAIDAHADLPDAVVGDAGRLGQVLTNLLANAIKFTDDPGRVRLGVSRVASGCDPAAAVRLRFEVEDTGIGIDPAMQARLFSPFVQAHDATQRRFGGTGLGLSIVKRLVTLMGGAVGFKSASGAGSTFWVEISLAVAEAAQLPSAAVDGGTGRALSGVRVLVVDDSEINLEVARRILDLEGAKTTLARHGEEAIALLRRHPGAFDVVLMDVQMPVLDGHQATRRIRDDIGLAALPVIALTAGALTSEHQRARAAGMDDFVTKPFEAGALVRTLLRHVQPPPVASSRPTPAAAATASRKVAALAMPAATPAWPVIEGIDTDDVRGRLGADAVLFRSMLRRLLGEFGGLAAEVAPSSAADAQALRSWAGRMHKLKGSAYLLGATAIGMLADRAEAACRAGEARRALRWIRLLAARLDELRTAAAAALAAGGDDDGLDASVGDAPGAPLEVDRLHDLVAQLEAQSMDALDGFAALAPQLHCRLGRADFGLLREHLEDLDFPAAVDLLARRAPALTA